MKEVRTLTVRNNRHVPDVIRVVHETTDLERLLAPLIFASIEFHGLIDSPPRP